MTDSDNDEIDVTLLRGLEPIMSPGEQVYLTKLFTSGDPNCLAAAAKILYELGRAAKDGNGSICVNNGTLVLSKDLTPAQKELIQTSFESSSESFRTHFKHKNDTKYYTNNNRRRPAFKNQIAQQKKDNDRDAKVRSHALPLPVRMPRYVVLDPFDPDLPDAAVGRNKQGKNPTLTFQIGRAHV